MKLTRFRYDIQGLRAIAVLSVVIFHAFPDLLTGGFLGVDIFFVISGYLITGSITKDIELGRFSLKEFYRRRIRRLFPALSLVVIFCIVVGYRTLDPREFLDFNKSVISTMLFVSNIFFMQNTDYFGGAAESMPLLHTWSLSVEEQFYILFPIFLFLLYRFFRKKSLATTIVLTILGLVLSEMIVRLRPEWGYFFTPARAFELMIGASVSLMAAPFSLDGKPKTANLLAGTGILMMLVPMVLYTSKTPFPGIAAAIPCLGAGMVLLAGTHLRTLTGRLLSTLPFQFFGNLSYSLYLWHWPLLAFPRAVLGVDLAPEVAGIAVIAAILISAASYRWVETPFIRPGYPKLPYLTVGTSMIAVFCGIAMVGVSLKGMPDRFSPEARALFAARTAGNPEIPGQKPCLFSGKHAGDIKPYGENCVFGPPGVAADVVVWGDSHGAAMARALGEAVSLDGHALRQVTLASCPPAMGLVISSRPNCVAQNKASLAAILADANVHTVILGTYYQPIVMSQLPAFETAFTETVRALREGGKQVIIMMPVPSLPVEVPKTLGFMHDNGGDLATFGITRAEFEESVKGIPEFMASLAARYGAVLFDPASFLCTESLCRTYDPQIGVFYRDRHHLTLQVARTIAPAIRPLLPSATEVTKAAAPR